MNYYEHHIGDYDKNTSHLTACEDGIYSRLIRRYYDKEKPLPADVNEVKRLARARSRDERAAVDSVLAEFFHLEADGWHHDKCDEVISAYQAGEPEREAKKKNEDTRLQRHRVERAELFAVINGAGQHMAWNTPIAELRAAAERIRNAATATPETPLQPAPETPPATATATPATATQTPLPTPHSPLPSTLGNTSEASPLHPPAASPPAGDVPAVDPKPEGTGLPACPHERLLAIYAKHLPQLQQPRVWEGARVEAMRARWRQCSRPSAFGKGYATVEDGVAFWEKFFRYVATCPALRDGIPRSTGGRWYADLPWLLKAENFAKVIEGKYSE